MAACASSNPGSAVRLIAVLSVRLIAVLTFIATHTAAFEKAIEMEASAETYFNVERLLEVKVSNLPNPDTGLIVTPTGSPPNDAVTVSPSVIVFNSTGKTKDFFVITGATYSFHDWFYLKFLVNGSARDQYATTGEIDVAVRVRQNITGRARASTYFAADGVADEYVLPVNYVRIDVGLSSPPSQKLLRYVDFWPDPSVIDAGIKVCNQVRILTPEEIAAGMDPCQTEVLKPGKWYLPLNNNDDATRSVTGTLYVYSYNATSAPVPIILHAQTEEPGEYVGPYTMDIGKMNFKPLEKVLVCSKACLPPVIFLGEENRQTFSIELTGPPKVKQNVELRIAEQTLTWHAKTPYVKLDTGIGGMIRFDGPDEPGAAYTGVLTKYINVTALRVTEPGKPIFITLAWRDRSSPLSAKNFEDIFNIMRFNVTVKDLYSFRASVEGRDVELGQPTRLFPGEKNRIAVTVVADDVPALPGTRAVVEIDLGAQAQYFRTDFTELVFENGRPLSQVFHLWIETGSPVGDYAALNVSLRMKGPSEYRNVVRSFEVRLVPLMAFNHSLTTTFMPVGAANALSFTIWPPEPISLQLRAISSCGEIGFGGTPVWVNSAAPRVMTLVASHPVFSCTISLESESGDSIDKVVRIPFTYQIEARPQPRLLFRSPEEVSSRIISGDGLKIVLGLSGGPGWSWMWNPDVKIAMPSQDPAAGIHLSSSLPADMEPAGLAAVWGASLASETPFVQAVFDAKKNTVTIKIGPSGAYLPQYDEEFTIAVHSQAVVGNVTFVSGTSSFTFRSHGETKQLINPHTKKALASAAATATIANIISGPTAATQGSKLLAIANVMSCPNNQWRRHQEQFSWNEAPLLAWRYRSGEKKGKPVMFFTFGSQEELGTFAVMALSNTVFLGVCIAVHMFFAWRVQRSRSEGSFADKSFSAALALSRFPSLQLFPALFFYQGIIGSATKTLLYSPSSVVRLSGGVSFLVVGLGVLGYLGAKLLVRFPCVWKEIPRDELVKRNYVFRYLCSPGEWFHPSEYFWFTANCKFFDEFRGGRHWFIIFDVVLVFVIGCVEGIEPTTVSGCNTKVAFLATLFIIQFGVVLALRPFGTMFMNQFFILAYTLQMVAMLLVCYSVWALDRQEYWGTDLGINVLFMLVSLLFFKTIVDISRVLADFFNFTTMLKRKPENRFERALDMDESTTHHIMTEQLMGKLLEDEREAIFSRIGERRASRASPKRRQSTSVPEVVVPPGLPPEVTPAMLRYDAKMNARNERNGLKPGRLATPETKPATPPGFDRRRSGSPTSHRYTIPRRRASRRDGIQPVTTTSSVVATTARPTPTPSIASSDKHRVSPVIPLEEPPSSPRKRKASRAMMPGVTMHASFELMRSLEFKASMEQFSESIPMRELLQEEDDSFEL